MQTNYFIDCSTVEETKKLYKELPLKNHPDLGGSTAIMQEINAQYEAKLKRLDGQTSTNEKGMTHTYKYDAETEAKLIEIIDQLLALQMPSVEIFLVGTWIWVHGKTKPFKEQLKALKCRWHSTRKLWYFAINSSRRYRKSGEGIDDIVQAYGASKINKTTKKKLKVLASK